MANLHRQSSKVTYPDHIDMPLPMENMPTPNPATPPEGPIALTTDLGRYILQKTDDQHDTLWSEAFGECCHSSAGAVSETIYHYIQGTHLLARQKSTPLHILEIGFGTGLGFKLTQQHLSSPFIFTAVELDCQLAQWALENMGIKFCDSQIKLLTPDTQWHQWNLPNCQLNLLIGNARHTIQAVHEKLFQLQPVDAIYQDAFSPKQNPVLWTTEWFTQLLTLSNQHCLMATYSASKRARKSMALAGWQVYQAPGHGQKRQSTRACHGEMNIQKPDDWQLISEISLNSKGLSFSDNELA